MNPILTDCQWGFNQSLSAKVNLTRNQQVFDSEFFSIADFSNGNFKWSLHIKDQEMNQSLEYDFGQSDFEELTGQQADALFKIVAHRKIIDPNHYDKAKKLQLALKHQVLSDQTAVIGVFKQEDIASGEL